MRCTRKGGKTSDTSNERNSRKALEADPCRTFLLRDMGRQQSVLRHLSYYRETAPCHSLAELGSPSPCARITATDFCLHSWPVLPNRPGCRMSWWCVTTAPQTRPCRSSVPLRTRFLSR